MAQNKVLGKKKYQIYYSFDFTMHIRIGFVF